MLNFDLSHNIIKHIDLFMYYDLFQIRRHTMIVLEVRG